MATIGIFDSGVGGLSVLREIRKLLPGERLIYFADNAFCPYGEKTQAFICERAREITLELVREGADIIVVACNTATGAAIASLRKEFSFSDSPALKEASGGRLSRIRFIGMEPAVKPAALGTKTDVIGVLATAGTLAGAKYLANKEKYEDEILIEEHVGQGFVELVESGVTEGPKAEETVSRSLLPLLEAGADIVVLGCTHYPFLSATIQKVADCFTTESGLPRVSLIDPAPAVARQLLKVMDEEGIARCGQNKTGETILRSSGPEDTLLKVYSTL